MTHPTRQPPSRELPLAMALCLALAACVPAPPPPVTRLAEPGQITTQSTRPEGGNGCWANEETPPVTRKETAPVLVQPAQLTSSGEVLSPPIYRREPRDVVVKPAVPHWFETPCPAEMTPAFISSVQRALAARQLYSGPITGEMDARTRRAIQAYQAPQGLASGTLSLTAARQLGLAPVPRPEAG